MKILENHFLQSDAWAAFQAALPRTCITKTTATWHALAVIEEGKLGKRLYCPYGPTLLDKESLPLALTWLKNEARARNLDFIRIEPLIQGGFPVDSASLHDQGLLPSQKDVQPKYTIQVDLQKSAENLLGAMSQTTRNLYRNIHKKGVSFRESSNPEDMKELTKMLAVVATRTGMKPHSDDYLQTEARILLEDGRAKLFIAEVEEKPVAMALIYCGENGWYYSHAASYETARKLQVMQPLVAHIIMAAHTQGVPMFDLYGIAPPDAPAHHPLTTITKFKMSFGGHPITYSGTWELPVRPLRYRLYRLLRAVAKI